MKLQIRYAQTAQSDQLWNFNIQSDPDNQQNVYRTRY